MFFVVIFNPSRPIVSRHLFRLFLFFFGFSAEWFKPSFRFSVARRADHWEKIRIATFVSAHFFLVGKLSSWKRVFGSVSAFSPRSGAFVLAACSVFALLLRPAYAILMQLQEINRIQADKSNQKQKHKCAHSRSTAHRKRPIAAK